MTKHKWHDEIVAWAGGAEIEAKSGICWRFEEDPEWNNTEYVFRIKPQPKQPKYLYVYTYNGAYSFSLERMEECDYDGEFIGKIEVQDD